MSLFDYLVISTLSMEPTWTMRMGELAQRVNGSLSRLSDVAKRLERRQLLTRFDEPEDGRFTWARLTETGWQVVVAVAPAPVKSVRRWVMNPLSQTQIKVLGDLGKRLCPELLNE